MNKYIKILSLSLALTGAVFLPNVNATSSTDMLITIAESNPVLLERLNVIALDDAVLLNQLLQMAESKPAQLERLLDLVESDLEAYEPLVSIHSAKATLKEGDVSTKGTIKDGGLKR